MDYVVIQIYIFPFEFLFGDMNPLEIYSRELHAFPFI